MFLWHDIRHTAPRFLAPEPPKYLKSRCRFQVICRDGSGIVIPWNTTPSLQLPPTSRKRLESLRALPPCLPQNSPQNPYSPLVRILEPDAGDTPDQKRISSNDEGRSADWPCSSPDMIINHPAGISARTPAMSTCPNLYELVPCRVVCSRLILVGGRLFHARDNQHLH